MKTTKSFIFLSTLCLFFFICLCCFFPASSYNAKATADFEKNKTEYLNNLENSINVYPEIIAHFTLQKQYLTNYSDKTSQSFSSTTQEYTQNFGGIFLDENGMLNVQYIQNDEELVKLKKLSDTIKLQTVNFSYNYLQAIQNYLSLALIDFNITSLELIQKENRIIVYTTNNSEINQAAIMSYLDKFDTNAKNAIVFKTATINEAFSKVAQAGTEIWYNHGFLNIYKSSGTICANVVHNASGKKGVLTNAHVAIADKTMKCSAGKINKASTRQLSGSVDAAFVPFPNDDWILDDTAHASDSTSYGNVHYNGTQYIVEGYPTIKLGISTGNTSGTILSTSTTTTFTTSSGDSHTLSDLVKISNQGDHGDSGGPIYYNGGAKGNKNLIAMTVGGSTYTYGCKIANVVSALNLTIITAQNIYNY